MPVAPSHPGVYVEELQSRVQAIAGVATSITAFIGRAARGPLDTAVPIDGFGNFTSIFGGLWADSAMSYAVGQFFLNGGTDAIIVRVANDATTATVTLPGAAGPLTLQASSPGTWGDGLTAAVDTNTSDPGDATAYDLTLVDTSPGGITEVFRNVSAKPGSGRDITTVLAGGSTLARVQGTAPAGAPSVTAQPVAFDAGSDGAIIGDDQITGSDTAPKTGIHALDDVDLFNLLCIPPYHDDETVANPDPGVGALGAALAYCITRRAMLIVDPPITWTNANAALTAGVPSGFGPLTDPNAVLYFPRIVVPDALRDNQPAAFAPCGAVAGVIARTDASRGVWKAPAGGDAKLLGVVDLSVHLTDADNGTLNTSGINSLRSLAGIGQIVWGARTLAGADALAAQWKYLSVRRLALYLEESLSRGTQWVLFEPDAEPLWAQIRLAVNAFMTSLFKQGAFQGSTPSDAFFVRCDATTTTQADIDQGIVVIEVGFAPLKPAEFVSIAIRQPTGQTTGP